MLASSKPRLAVIGAGRFGRHYIKNILDADCATLVAVVSNNPETANLVPDFVQIVGEWETIIHPKLIDGVIIVTPPDTHAAISIAALDAGVPVLCEKPLTLSVDEARGIGKHLKQDSIFQIDHIHLFNGAYQVLKNNLKRVGTVRVIESCGGNDGPFREVSGYWDYGPHDVSMTLDVLSNSDWEVHGFNKLAPETGNKDAANFLLELEHSSGVIASLTFGNGMRQKQRWFKVTGDDGELLYDDLAPHRLEFIGHDERREVIPHDYKPPLAVVISRFAQTIAAGKSDVEDYDLGLKIVEIMAKGYTQNS